MLGYLAIGLEGTLIREENKQAFARAFGRAIGSLHIGIGRNMGRSHYVMASGTSLKKQISDIIEGGRFESVSYKKIEAACGLFWDTIAEEPVVMVPDARETLEKLGKMGIKVLVSSEMPPKLVSKMVHDLEIPVPGLVEMALGSKLGFPRSQHVDVFSKHCRVDFDSFCRKLVIAGINREDMLIANDLKRLSGTEYPISIGIKNASRSNKSLKIAGAEYLCSGLNTLPDAINEINNIWKL
jgi:phosphoglycolate phosphatase-like HAD superfamily hydrolase